MIEPTPNINKACAMLVERESHISMASSSLNGEGTDLAALMAGKGSFHKYNRGTVPQNYNKDSTSQPTYYNKGKKNWDLKCDYCNMQGHVESNCFRLHGYPPDWKLKKKGTGNTNNAYNVQTEGASARGKSMDSSINENLQRAPQLTTDQHGHIMNMLDGNVSTVNAMANMAASLHDEYFTDVSIQSPDLPPNSSPSLLHITPAPYPIDTNAPVSVPSGEQNDEPFEDRELYQRLVGKMLYLTMTRLDIAYSVQKLSQFLQNPKKSHWEAVLRVMRYIKREPGLGILLSSKSSNKLSVHCDADWASCPNTRRSVSGFIVKHGETLLSWKSKKQNVVSRSSAEAEYRSMKNAVSELV
uniref:Reverse transcriptase Ty1/copia-type domain-containing protein n=1 Tax=Solanum lycopersicum TaxID=4081 RepID=A0A3Q7FJT0_SOLLC